jgi:hypothetical protein
LAVRLSLLLGPPPSDDASSCDADLFMAVVAGPGSLLEAGLGSMDMAVAVDDGRVVLRGRDVGDVRPHCSCTHGRLKRQLTQGAQKRAEADDQINTECSGFQGWHWRILS